MDSMRCLRKPFLFFGIVLGLITVAAQPHVPVLQQHVNDFTNSLTFDQWRTLESKLQGFEDSTSTQIAILLFKSLNGEAIEDYSMKVFELNKLGRRGKNNGVLVVVAKDDRMARIEVGYGLEGVLPDALASQIVEREMKPRFREGNLYAGLAAGASAIIAATAGEYKAQPKGEIAPTVSASLLLFAFIFFFFFFMPMLASRRRVAIHSGNWIYHSGWGPGFGGWSGGFFGGGGGGGWGGGGWSGGGGFAGGGGATGRW